MYMYVSLWEQPSFPRRSSEKGSSAKAGHRSRSPNEGETGDTSANLNATHQVGRGLESEVLTLWSSAKAECSYQGVDNGGGVYAAWTWFVFTEGKRSQKNQVRRKPGCASPGCRQRTAIRVEPSQKHSQERRMGSGVPTSRTTMGRPCFFRRTRNRQKFHIQWRHQKGDMTGPDRIKTHDQNPLQADTHLSTDNHLISK